MDKEKLCIACDISCYDEIIALVDQLKDIVGYFKFNSAFTLFGPALIEDVKKRGVKVFLDLKFHDIPNTVENHVRACVEMGIDMLTIHASGGQKMMQKAVEAAQLAQRKLKVIAVTVMTSMSQEDLNTEMCVQGSLSNYIIHCASSAVKIGVDGIVCSASDIAVIRPKLSDRIFYVTPGIRMVSAIANTKDDQKRIMTPQEAINAGSSLLVLGRPVYTARYPREVIQELYDS